MRPAAPTTPDTKHFDVFNGDADGICALQQLRLHTPRPGAHLITGVKRDSALLQRVEATPGSRITVLDVSLDRNREPLNRLLAQGCRVFYADHHFSGSLPDSPLLEAHIDPSARTCTSLIVDRLLHSAHSGWALAGAYGDSLDETAGAHGRSLGYNDDELMLLAELGRLLNYNSYGRSERDLHIHPADLYRALAPYADPLQFCRESPMLTALRRGHAEDTAAAAHLKPYREFPGGRVFLLPQAAWAARMLGPLANRLCRERPELAHALLLPLGNEACMVSVRAPLHTAQGADSLCRAYATGGGRAAAAGINHLPRAMQEQFLADFAAHFPQPAPA
ncbi:MAG: acetyltransferase [Desulfobulbus sp.]|jgi:hypothetical protein